MVTQTTSQATYSPPPLPPGSQPWSPNAVPVRFNPTTRTWEMHANGQWLPRPGLTFDQVNAMGRAGQAFQIDYAASGGQANTAAVQREIAPAVFAPDNAQLSPEGSILAPGTATPPRQAVATQQPPNPRVFSPDGAQLSPEGAILSPTPATSDRRGLPSVADVAATAPPMAPPPERGNNPNATFNAATNTWNVDPAAQWNTAPAAAAPPAAPSRPLELPTSGDLRAIEAEQAHRPAQPQQPGQPPTREQQWLDWLLGGSRGATPAFAEGGSQNIAGGDGGGGRDGERHQPPGPGRFPGTNEEGWQWLGPDASGRYIVWVNRYTGETRKTLVAFAEGGSQPPMPDGPMGGATAPAGPLPLPDAIVGEGLETATPQFDTPERSELTLQPMPAFGPDIFKVNVAEGPTGVQANGGMLVLPLSEPTAVIAREHLRPAEGIKGEMDGSQFESGPLSLPTTPGPGGAPGETPAMATGGLFGINPPSPGNQQPQPPTFEGVPPLDPSQVQRGVLPPASLAVPSPEWAGLPGGAPPPMGNVNDFSRTNDAQRARYDQWLKSLGILSGIQGAEQYFRRTAPSRLNLPTVMG